MNHVVITEWQKAEISRNGNCFEQRGFGDSVQVRDTKNRDKGTLSLSKSTYSALLDSAKTGKLDSLLG